MQTVKTIIQVKFNKERFPRMLEIGYQATQHKHIKKTINEVTMEFGHSNKLNLFTQDTKLGVREAFNVVSSPNNILTDTLEFHVNGSLSTPLIKQFADHINEIVDAGFWDDDFYVESIALEEQIIRSVSFLFDGNGERKVSLLHQGSL